MEYGESLTKTSYKNNLYNTTNRILFDNYNLHTNNYFTQDTVKNISNKVSQLLIGVHPQGKKIVVDDKVIVDVMNSIYESYKPPTKDIYNKDRMLDIDQTICNRELQMITQVIETIVTDVKNNLGTIECNQKLSAWNMVYGSHNEHGLMSHSKIKLNNKRPSSFQFHMRY